MARAPLAEWLTQAPPEPQWLVPGIWARGTMQVLAGDPGVGKSVLAYSLALAVALGGEFLGQRIEQGKVLYFDEENSESDSRAYMHTLWRGLGRPGVAPIEANLHLDCFGLAKYESPWKPMKMLVERVQPTLIVLDTATPCCHIEDENHNGEASGAIRQLRRILACAPAGATMLVLKHARFNHEAKYRDIRGAKAWKGETDGTVFHTAAAGRPPKGLWRRTYLEPSKVRAFGLRSTLAIDPTPVGSGYVLTAKAVEEREG